MQRTLGFFFRFEKILLLNRDIFFQIGILDIVFGFLHGTWRFVVTFYGVMKFAYFFQTRIMAASAKMVPLPHIGSKKSPCPSQPESKIIPAANTSLIGAIFVAVL